MSQDIRLQLWWYYKYYIFIWLLVCKPDIKRMTHDIRLRFKLYYKYYIIIGLLICNHQNRIMSLDIKRQLKWYIKYYIFLRDYLITHLKIEEKYIYINSTTSGQSLSCITSITFNMNYKNYYPGMRKKIYIPMI